MDILHNMQVYFKIKHFKFYVNLKGIHMNKCTKILLSVGGIKALTFGNLK